MFLLLKVGGTGENKWTEHSIARIYLLIDNCPLPGPRGPSKEIYHLFNGEISLLFVPHSRGSNKGWKHYYPDNMEICLSYLGDAPLWRFPCVFHRKIEPHTDFFQWDRCCCQVTSVVSDSVRPHRRQPTRLPHPWDSSGKNTGVGCHFLLQCMKVKSEKEVTQSCPTLSDLMDCSLPGSSVHGIFQARVLEWGAEIDVRYRQFCCD